MLLNKRESHRDQYLKKKTLGLLSVNRPSSNWALELTMF